LPAPPPPEAHGGNRQAAARRLGCAPDQLLEASASLVPFGPPPALLRVLRSGAAVAALRDYPDRSYSELRAAIARLHGLDPAWVLPGNGAAELFTWAARDAAAAGVSLLPVPDVVETLDYEVILAAMKADLAARAPELAAVLALESEPVVKLLEVCAYRELLLRARGLLWPGPLWAPRPSRHWRASGWSHWPMTSACVTWQVPSWPRASAFYKANQLPHSALWP
jgi:hypothetical protein